LLARVVTRPGAYISQQFQWEVRAAAWEILTRRFKYSVRWASLLAMVQALSKHWITDLSGQQIRRYCKLMGSKSRECALTVSRQVKDEQRNGSGSSLGSVSGGP
jgi:hypothetical protein